ncbi:type II toxin-antitoxin system VapB family antitoxin [Aquipuribacter nitratireducens]|uniref:Type II toxin-antitoxin system VapB family antitoxin n=1 Tax=Aquipuribacter nitratireducens TaxID=650104 RepID=A0ABW0GQA6_9MICO
MALTIKNASTEALARAVAERTGEGLTQAVTTALEERLARLARDADRDARRRRLLDLAADAGRRWPDHLVTVEHGDLLYDERGLPR